MAMIAFVVFMAGAWTMLSLISNRNMSTAEQRLERIGRPKSLAGIELGATKKNSERFSGLKETMQNLGSALEPKNELEKNSLKVKLANAGFRSEGAASIFHGLRIASLAAFLLPAIFIFGLKNGWNMKSMQWILVCGGVGFYLPAIVLWHLR